jgi:hypothetical protein
VSAGRGWLPAHAPGCQPLAGMRSMRDGEQRYICTPRCPHRLALDAQLYGPPGVSRRDPPGQQRLFELAPEQ